MFPDLRLILAVRSAGLPTRASGTDFVPMEGISAVRALEEAGLWFGPREELEMREDYRQVIPYVVLRSGSRVLSYTRASSGGEARLHGRLSIGLGGHVDLCDARSDGAKMNLRETVECAARRELAEELGDVNCRRRRWVGLLVDDRTAVGRAHIGIVAVWDVANLPASSAEDAIGHVAPASIPKLKACAERLEAWSASLLPWLADDVSGGRRSGRVPAEGMPAEITV